MFTFDPFRSTCVLQPPDELNVHVIEFGVHFEVTADGGNVVLSPGEACRLARRILAAFDSNDKGITR